MMDGIRLVLPTYMGDSDPEHYCTVQHCSRCGTEVWFAEDQQIPPEAAGLPLVCVACALRDPELAEEVLQVWFQARSMHLWAGGT
jgi:hypothetical protein